MSTVDKNGPAQPTKSRDELVVETRSAAIWRWVREHRNSMDSRGAAKRIERHMWHAIARVARDRDRVKAQLEKAREDAAMWRQTAKDIEKMMFDADEENVRKIRELEDLCRKRYART